MYEFSEVLEAFHDRRVQRALGIAVRDARIRRRFRELKKTMTMELALLELSGEVPLSEDHIKTIVYRKGRG